MSFNKKGNSEEEQCVGEDEYIQQVFVNVYIMPSKRVTSSLHPRGGG